MAAGTACDDGEVCSVDDRCDDAGACTGTADMTCGSAEVCVAGVGCTDIHCLACVTDADCGADGRCAVVAGGQRCLLECANDDYCGPDGSCLTSAFGVLCYDDDGDCAWPGSQAEAENEAESGVENEAESGVESESPNEDATSGAETTDDTGSVADATTPKSEGGCGGGSAAAGLWLAAIGLGWARRRRSAA
jgi:hypothetical protein